MKKIKGFFIGLILAIITVVIFVPIQVQKINQYYKVNDNSVRYNTSYNKHKSREILKANYDENTHLLLGSSELSVANKKEFHPTQMFNYADYDTEESGYYREFNLVRQKRDETRCL